MRVPRTYRYGSDASQVADLHLPAGGGPWPVAAVIHGGFWRARYDRTLMDAVCADLATRGWAAWNLEYRRIGPGGNGGWPATFDDVSAGIDQLARLDAPIDIGRVVDNRPFGRRPFGSLGCHSGATSGYLTGTIGQAAVTDLAQASRLGLSDGAVNELLGGGPAEVPERYAAASPVQRLPLGVPTLLVHGARDDTVPVTFSLEFRAAAVAAGDTCDLVVGRTRRPLRAHRSRVGRVGYGDAVAAGPLTRAHALELDRADPLAGFRDRFEFGDGDRIYVDGNSLGRLAVDARRALEATVDDWGVRLVTGWHDWVDLAQRVGDRLGEAALGADPGQVLVCDSTTVNLYKLAGAVLAVRPGAIVVPSDDFPTDRYVLEGLAAAGGRELRLLDCDPVHGPQPDAVAAAAEGAALVVLSHVNYRSGALADMPAVTRAVQAAGAIVLWDLCHSAGAVEVALDDAGADLAVGCTYKYLNAGPGSPAFLYVARRHQDALRSPIQGWFSQADQFAMGPGYAGDGHRPLPGRDPPVLGLALVESGGVMLRQAGIGRSGKGGRADIARGRPARRAARAARLLARHAARPGARGAHVSLRHPDAWRMCRALIEHANVVPDFRRPDSIRLGPAAALHALRRRLGRGRPPAALVSEGVHERMPAEASRVT